MEQPPQPQPQELLPFLLFFIMRAATMAIIAASTAHIIIVAKFSDIKLIIHKPPYFFPFLKKPAATRMPMANKIAKTISTAISAVLKARFVVIFYAASCTALCSALFSVSGLKSR